MDVHEVPGAVAMEDVAKAHLADLQTQETYDVRYLRYWVDEKSGRIFCLVEAPSADAAAQFTGRPTDWSPITSTGSKKDPRRRTRNEQDAHHFAGRRGGRGLGSWLADDPGGGA